MVWWGGDGWGGVRRVVCVVVVVVVVCVVVVVVVVVGVGGWCGGCGVFWEVGVVGGGYVVGGRCVWVVVGDVVMCGMW